jgi:hypothetical protein
MTIPSPRKVGELLFLTSFYNGSLLLRVGSDKPSLVWQSKKVSEMDTDGLHSVMATPLIENGHIYSPCSYGQFRCLKLGDRRAPLGNLRADQRQIRALGPRLHRKARRPQFSLQRKGRPHHREA